MKIRSSQGDFHSTDAGLAAPHAVEDFWQLALPLSFTERLELSDQLKSLDWRVRKARKKATVSGEVMLHVRAKLKALLQL